jgi:alkanesulfonate monooxygenase SsuD/methylene tetrahydromethanopterin reductase-like flavin-dependent oxidoreductase (luciferase family)
VQAALFSSVPYLGPVDPGWPVPGRSYSIEVGERSMQESLEQLQLADELGFDWVTVAEHHFGPLALTPNPMVMAGALTQRVRRARIALLGATIPILNPVRVAEEFAMLDTLTCGRVVAGMLRGTSNEYVTYHVNPAESHERFEEALKLIVKCWTEPEPFGWQGRYYEYRSISIWPRPVQQPHPPVLMSGSSPESGEMAARNRVRLGFAVTTVPLASQAADHYRAQAALAGWEPTPEDILYRVSAHVAETDEEALEDLRARGGDPRPRVSRENRTIEETAARAGYYGRDEAAQRGRVARRGVEEQIELGSLIAGGPETVFSQVRAIRDAIGAGVLEVIFAPLGREKTLRGIELFGTRVLPRMREL